ncbi:MAG: hypothetical protein Wins2KO_26650 [Winogradskyella sp.]
MVSDFCDTITILNNNQEYITKRKTPPYKPYSSMIIAKMKSDDDCGKKFYCTLLPGPSGVIPVAIAILAFSI